MVDVIHSDKAQDRITLCLGSRKKVSAEERTDPLKRRLYYYASILNTIDLYVFMDIIISYRAFELCRQYLFFTGAHQQRTTAEERETNHSAKEDCDNNNFQSCCLDKGSNAMPIDYNAG